jgi:hypothetical protein
MSSHPAANLFKEAWDRVVADQIRQNQLDALYEKDGRFDPAHPAHATYTGLWVKYNG